MIEPDLEKLLQQLIIDDSDILIQHWLSFFPPEEQELQHRYYANFLSFLQDCVTEHLEPQTDSYQSLFSFMVKLSKLIGEEKFYNFRNSVFTYSLKFPILHWLEIKGEFTFKNVATLTAFFESLTSQIMLDYVRKQRHIEETISKELKERETPMSIVSTRVLMVSMVGTLDSQRLVTIIDRVLDRIEQENIKHIIIDINAIDELNLEMVNQLIKLNKAVNLMGAYTYLAGITKSVANTLIKMDINLGNLRTYHSTKDALQEINRLNKEEY